MASLSLLANPAPDGVSLADLGAFESAAMRLRQGVKPQGGRTEGVATKVLENYLPHAASGFFSLPMRATQAAGELQRQGDVYDPAPALEAAMMMVGAPGTPRGAVGSGIRAYHGSPHDFDRFDLSKIGTGEGAQAYGHGLYFAENPATAQSYRDALAGKNNTLTNRAILDKFGGDTKKAADYLRNLAPDGSPLAKYYEDVAKKIESGAPLSGRMYEVNINAAPEQFLDWDKPLAQHAPGVSEAVLSLPRVAKQNAHQLDFLGPDKGLTGGGAYRSMIENYGVDLTPKNNAAASAELRNAGIPGIKYLDQGSRAAGQGSSNYVLFRDDIVDILRKYGITGAAALPLADTLARPDSN
jgi:hypothetical protein